MPKSSKKKKEKAADFSKAKLKLGKGKASAANAIDTSFKAKSIALPSQSITTAEDDIGPTTHRKLTFDDLIVQLRHYNATVRRDAVIGLKELLGDHPLLLKQSLAVVLSAFAKLISDEDASVRKALLGVLEWLLQTVPEDVLKPHAPGLLLFTASAQTHIFAEIRIDAIRFIDLLLSVVPEVVVAGWTDDDAAGGSGGGHGRRVLNGYLALLNLAPSNSKGTAEPNASTSTSGLVLSPASKLLVLKSLSRFLHCVGRASGLEPSPTDLPAWISDHSPDTAKPWHFFGSHTEPMHSGLLPRHQARLWNTVVDHDSSEDFCFSSRPFAPSWSLSDIISAVDIDDRQGTVNTSSNISQHMAELAHRLQPILTSTFLDAAPTSFGLQSRSAPASELGLQSIFSVACILRSLYRHVILDGSTASASPVTMAACDDLRALLLHMDPYFPFSVQTLSQTDLQTEQTLRELNVMYCELTSLLASAASNMDQEYLQVTPPNRGTRSRKHRPAAFVLQIDRIADFIVQTLSTTVGRSITAISMSAEMYLSMLPALWILLSINSLGPAESHALQQRILKTVVEHSLNLSSTSPLKPLSLDFVARLIFLQHERRPGGSIRSWHDPSTKALLEEWIQALPKALWELGDKNLDLTEKILQFLLRMCQRRAAGDDMLASLQTRLAPYFTITHQTRGKLPGPFAKLPGIAGHGVRRLALDLAFTLDSRMDGPLGDAVWQTLDGQEESFVRSLVAC